MPKVNSARTAVQVVFAMTFFPVQWVDSGRNPNGETYNFMALGAYDRAGGFHVHYWTTSKQLPVFGNAGSSRSSFTTIAKTALEAVTGGVVTGLIFSKLEVQEGTEW